MSIVIPGKLGSIVDGVVGFFAGPWGRFAVYALMVLSALFGFKLWLNSHDDRVYASAMDKTKAKFEAQYVKQWKDELAKAEDMMSDAEAKLSAATELNRKIDKKFATIFASLGQIRQAVEDRKVVYVKEASSIPPAELDDALRTLSNHIAAQAPH